MQKYWHIDNGGVTVTVDQYGSLTISFGFHGYSETTINLTPNKEFSIASLAAFLLQANSQRRSKKYRVLWDDCPAPAPFNHPFETFDDAVNTIKKWLAGITVPDSKFILGAQIFYCNKVAHYLRIVELSA